MIEIYREISKLSDKFRTMTYGLINDKNEVDELVQELMIYFMQMNQETLKRIWEKDGEEGIIRYGAVALRRAYTSPRSNYFYKYKKYYTNLQDYYVTDTLDNYGFQNKSIENLPEIIEDNYQSKKLDKIDNTLAKDFTWYDKKIFELYYYEGNTLDSLAAKTSISRNSLFTTIDKVRGLLKKKLNE